MSFSKGFNDSLIKDFESSVTDKHILSHYLNITSIPCLINAPYRQDKKPSLSIFEANGKIKFIDFATGYKGGLIDLLMRVWNCSFKQCANIILNDLDVKKATNQINHIETNRNKIHKSSIDINVKFREWKDYDIEYWESYGISKNWLIFGDVYPISRIFCINNGIIKDFPAEKYAYAYLERKDNIITYKIYQPKSTTFKWINKHDSSVWDLWTKLPKIGDNLIITSSRKDALCIWENTGIPSISLQGEGYIPKEHVVNELKSRFSNIFILYDNDFTSSENHGRLFATELSKKFNLIMIEIPDEYKSKDTSDLCLHYGRKKVNETIWRMVNDKLNNDNSPF